MEGLIKYGLISTITFGIFSLTYWLFFRNTSFFLFNRIYILFTMVFSSVLPFLRFKIPEKIGYTGHRIWFENTHESISVFTIPEKVKEYSYWHFAEMIDVIYVTGALFFAIRFLIGVVQILVLVRYSAEEKTNTDLRIFTHNRAQSPFSFFRALFINKTRYTHSEFMYILYHERAHSKQLHSLDLIFVELTAIINWFNPFVYFLKKMLKETHEFLADNMALKECGGLRAYQQLICKHNNALSTYTLTSGFKGRTMKRRIFMLRNKNKRYVYRYFVVFPIIVGLLLLFAFCGEHVPINENVQYGVPQGFPINMEQCKISSGYGIRTHPITKEKRMHYAIDFRAPLGTPVKSTASGTVIKVKQDWQPGKGYGRYIVVAHTNNYETWYTNLSGYKVKENQHVKKGDIIGFVGNSGVSTGPHLHYEIRLNGKNIDPTPLLKQE